MKRNRLNPIGFVNVQTAWESVDSIVIFLRKMQNKWIVVQPSKELNSLFEIRHVVINENEELIHSLVWMNKYSDFIQFF